MRAKIRVAIEKPHEAANSPVSSLAVRRYVPQWSAADWTVILSYLLLYDRYRKLHQACLALFLSRDALLHAHCNVQATVCAIMLREWL
jgi:hypothetical protein